MAYSFNAENFNVEGDMSDSSFGRGRLLSDRSFTPFAGRGKIE